MHEESVSDSQLAELLQHLMHSDATADASSSHDEATSASVPSVPDRNKKPEFVSIGIQTVAAPVDLAIPLWIASLPGEEEPSPGFGFGFGVGFQGELSSHNLQPTWDLTTSIAASSSAAAAPPTTAATARFRNPFPLYKDILQLVLRYLNAKELLISLHLSKAFYQAVQTSPVLGITSNANADGLMRMPASSTIGRHISCMTKLGAAIASSQLRFRRDFNLLHHLKMLLPNLTSMSIPYIRESHSIVKKNINWSLPASLRSLEICVATQEWASQSFFQIGKLHQLQELIVTIGEEHPMHSFAQADLFDEINFSPLSSLSRLQALQIRFKGQVGIQRDPATHRSNPSLARFIQHSSLKSLSVPAPSSQTAVQLLKVNSNHFSFPLMSSLTSLILENCVLDNELLRVLINYPNLTHMTLSLIRPGIDAKLFAKLPKMTELVINPSGLAVGFLFHSRENADIIVDVCQNLSNLRKLSVVNLPFSSKNLNDCLSSLPNLTDLELNGGGAPDIASLVKYSLPQRLLRLVLENFTAPYKDLVKYIIPLQRLETLHLIECCSTTTPEYDWQEQLRSIPNLRDYKCTDRLNAISLYAQEQAKRHAVESMYVGTRELTLHPYLEEVLTKDGEVPGVTICVRSFFFSMTAMKEYENSSFEELRLEDEQLGLPDASQWLPPPPTDDELRKRTLQSQKQVFPQDLFGPTASQPQTSTFQFAASLSTSNGEPWTSPGASVAFQHIFNRPTPSSAALPINAPSAIGSSKNPSASLFDHSPVSFSSAPATGSLPFGLGMFGALPSTTPLGLNFSSAAAAVPSQSVPSFSNYAPSFGAPLSCETITRATEFINQIGPSSSAASAQPDNVNGVPVAFGSSSTDSHFVASGTVAAAPGAGNSNLFGSVPPNPSTNLSANESSTAVSSGLNMLTSAATNNISGSPNR